MYRRQPGTASIGWVDVTTCPASMLGADLTREQSLARLHVRTADGELTSGALAFATLWTSIPRVAFLGRLTRRRPLLILLEVGYRVLLVVRKTWRKARP